ncbi:MAG: cell division protein FtsA [Holosporales bacterium]|jgi:cell division protein FtsA|nr:cell division protein FtsA [Holosporales bacterium]
MANRWLKDKHVAVFDIGSTKICCAVAKPLEGGGFDIIGYGQCLCKGVKSGFITDVSAVEDAIIKAVDYAENTARVAINSVAVSISSHKVLASVYAASLEVQGEVITQQDVLRVIARARPDLRSEGFEVIHVIPIEYTIDGNTGVSDPVGMIGRQLGVQLYVVAVPKLTLNNLLLSVSRCHIKVDGVFLKPYAASAAVTDDEDINSGVTVIVFGGGTTSFATFYKGSLICVETLPIGSAHITNDLSYGLKTSYESAERLKTLYGSVLPSANDNKEMILAPLSDQNDLTLQQVPRSELLRIIIPRVNEILDKLKAHFDTKPYLETITRKIILTGGGCQLPGLKNLVADRFGKPVSIETIRRIKSASTALDIKPDFSAAAGLMMFAYAKSMESNTAENIEQTKVSSIEGFWQTVSNWLIKNL